MQTKLRKV